MPGYLADCAAAALIMHKCVAGWHTPEMQSEFALHFCPALPPEVFGMHGSLAALHTAGL